MVQITELYRQLFGKNKLQDGNVIEMAEHGRAGGVSNGQSYKFIQEYAESSRIDEIDESTTYIGYVKNGSTDDTSSSIWRIQKIAVSGTQTIRYKADGDDKYNNVWDDRASLSYS